MLFPSTDRKSIFEFNIMRLPEAAPPDIVRNRLLCSDVPYPATVQRIGWQAYCKFINLVRHNFDHLFQADSRIRGIFSMIVELSTRIENVDSSVDSLAKLYAYIDIFRRELETYIMDLATASAANIKIAIQSEVTSGFKSAEQPALVSFLKSRPRKLYEELEKAQTLQETIDAWEAFKKDLDQPTNTHLRKVFRQPTDPAHSLDQNLDEKIAEINILIRSRYDQVAQLFGVVHMIDEIQRNIDRKDGLMIQIVNQEQTAAITEETIEDYCHHDLVECEDIKSIKDVNNNFTVTLGKTDSNGKRIERTILLIAPHNEDPIDSRNSFSQHAFSRMTLLAIFADMQATMEQETVVDRIEQPTEPVIIPTTPKLTFLQKVQNTWSQFKGMFSINRLRRSPVFAVGFALFLGLAHSGKTDHKTTQTTEPAPITTVTNTITNSVDEEPTPVATPDPTVTNTETQATVTQASTSINSRYSIDSHQHNTDETLQRMIKGMGFNSVQTKVIATRLDNQLQAARDLQAPGIRTQVNQNVVMEELNGQIRLSVQDASGHTLYGTSWFAREIGFRNFQPRK